MENSQDFRDGFREGLKRGVDLRMKIEIRAFELGSCAGYHTFYLDLCDIVEKSFIDDSALNTEAIHQILDRVDEIMEIRKMTNTYIKADDTNEN